MPPTTRRAAGAESEPDSDTDNEINDTVVREPSHQLQPTFTMTEGMLQTLVINITQSQAEANRILLESILRNTNGERASCPPSPSPPSASARAGNFAKCTARFDGAARSADELEAFIDAVEVYRECTAVSEEHALRGLPMLLVGEAAVWWRGVKADVTAWPDALRRLRGMYGVPRPAYKIFRDVFAHEQNGERSDVFVNKVRALLAKLPYELPEVVKIDIVYGLLAFKLRKRVCRDEVDSLEQLISRARLVEESLAEVSPPCFDISVSSGNPSARDCSNARINPTSLGEIVTSSQNSTERSMTAGRCDDLRSDERCKRIRPKCSYCKVFGHTIESCRNRSDDTELNRLPKVRNSSQIHCYGCGQPGVVRSKCGNCKNTPSDKSDFCTAAIESNSDPRPMVQIGIVNRTGVAILDTGATHSIAGSTLYPILVDAGVSFTNTSQQVLLADGSRVGTALECTVDVEIMGRIIPTTFLVFPNSQTRTLLGTDFIINASIILNLPRHSWNFKDRPGTKYRFISNFVLPAGGNQLTKADATHLTLRDEGAGLPAAQRPQLSTLRVESADRSEREISPPEYEATHRFKLGAISKPVASHLVRVSPGIKASQERKVRKPPDFNLRVFPIKGEGPAEYPQRLPAYPNRRRYDRYVRWRRVRQKRCSDCGVMD